ncbi:phage tail protein [Paenibacillus allorhizosphaerae]|uniref:Phage tail protein n=1 Tax=Paenibacillus allorhizosphaerae TaxID=2849866 RepID=A0ABN7TJU3_9BACL|nr:phage tail protein [Paenibacillus allorhizosphaerae]CAG7640799.1 hypothetical protein PAECIP111802_02685 [Paenibacillus allorhizosphaerae]
MSYRLDVFNSCMFAVDFQQIQVAGFSEVSGLQQELEMEEYAEGGQNFFVRKFPKRIKYPPLVLKKGIALTDELWVWYQDYLYGRAAPREGSIIMYGIVNGEKKEVRRWNFENAYPVKWVGPSFRGTSGEVAIESLELVHQGLKTK